MSKIVRLESPPIVEALIDIKCVSPEPFNYDIARKSIASIGYNDGQVDDVRVIKSSYQVNQETLEMVGNSENTLIGVLLRSEVNKKVVQFRSDGFIYSKLAPYESWTDLLDEFTKCWETYSGICKPDSITRIALRYINQIDLSVDKQGKLDINTYFTVAPQVPEPNVGDGIELPQSVGAYLSRVILPRADIDAVAIITQSMEVNKAQDNEIIPFILDIDIYVEKNINAQATDKVKSCLADLHDYKNDIFFSHVSDTCLEQYK